MMFTAYMIMRSENRGDITKMRCFRNQTSVSSPLICGSGGVEACLG